MALVEGSSDIRATSGGLALSRHGGRNPRYASSMGLAGLEMRMWVPTSLDGDGDLCLDPMKEDEDVLVFVFSIMPTGRKLLTQTKWNPRELHRDRS